MAKPLQEGITKLEGSPLNTRIAPIDTKKQKKWHIPSLLTRKSTSIILKGSNPIRMSGSESMTIFSLVEKQTK